MHKLEESQHEIDVFEALLERSNPSIQWGLEFGGGGSGSAKALHLSRVTPGSPAARIGLKSGDEVTEIGDTPTHGLTHQAAQDHIRHYGLSLILTVERRARGAIPVNPVVSAPQNADQPLSYQPYDMSGARPAPRAPPTYNFQTASSRPYEPPPERGQHASPQQVADYSQQHYEPQYQPHSDYTDHGQPQAQSRTFKMLQGLMSNDDVVQQSAGGSSMHPPSKVNYTNPEGQRVANRQFNSPISLYSRDAISNTIEDRVDGITLQDTEHFKNTSHPSSAPVDQKVLKNSDVLKLVRELDEKKTPGPRNQSPGHNTPWMKEGAQRKGAYNIYHQTDGSDMCTPPQHKLQTPDSRLSRDRNVAVQAEAVREQPLPQPSPPAPVQLKTSPRGTPIPSCISLQTPIGFRQSPTSNSDFGSTDLSHSPQRDGSLQNTPPAPTFVVKKFTPAASVDANFNQKPRPFRASAVTESPATAVTPQAPPSQGLGGPKMFTPPLWTPNGSEAAKNSSSNLNSNQNNNNNNSSSQEDSEEEPYAGSAGLPPPRSAAMEKWRQEEDAKRKGSPRVKVFMPQQYNSPLGMYSAGNVIDTFQTQAEIRMQGFERPGYEGMSEAQRAVMEQDHAGGRM